MSRFGGDDGPATVWDRSRFEAAARDRGDHSDVPVMERERYEEVERDYVRTRERSPPRREALFRESEEFDLRPRRERYYEEEQRDTYEGAMVHRPRERERDRGEERDIEIDIKRRDYDRDEPPRRASRPDGRPTFVRRQSSLDTHDRRPMARPADREWDRRRSSGRNGDWYEDDYYREENFGGYREREIERIRRRRSPSPESTVEEREEIHEEVHEQITEKSWPRKGKTKMPRRLVHKTALFELDYPYEEEGETIIIQYALGREDIDEVIALSKQMNKDGIIEETAKTVIYDKKSSRREPRIVERRKEIIRESSPPSTVPESVASWDAMAIKSKDWHKRQLRGAEAEETFLSVPNERRRRRRHSRAKSDAGSPTRAYIVEERDESAEITTGVGALVLKPQKHRRSKSIQREIIELESIKKERRRSSRPKVEVIQGTDYIEADGSEIVIAQEADEAEIIEVKKEKKAPDPRVFRAMLATLT